MFRIAMYALGALLIAVPLHCGAEGPSAASDTVVFRCHDAERTTTSYASKPLPGQSCAAITISRMPAEGRWQYVASGSDGEVVSIDSKTIDKAAMPIVQVWAKFYSSLPSGFTTTTVSTFKINCDIS